MLVGCPRPERSARHVCAATRTRGRVERTSEMPDYWAALEIERGAGAESVKAAYRRLQKVYHPDNAQGSAERSQQLNEAYGMLTEMSPAELFSYERELRLRGPAGPTFKDSASGMVGPIVEAQLLTTEEMPECEAGCDIDGLADMTDFVRQWAQTLTYSSDMPLPFPLQCDNIEGGARLGFIAIRRGSITMVGELLFTVMPAEDCDGDECFINPSTHGIAVGSETTISGAEGGAIPWVVAIRRRGSEKELLGEKRILRSFHDACKMHRTRINIKDEGFQLSGFLAAVAQGILGVLPILGGQPHSYESYYLKRLRPSPLSQTSTY